MVELSIAVLAGSLVVVVAILATRFGSRFGLPSLLIFLAIGAAIGDSGLGVRFDNFELANVIGFTALVLILAEGGLTTRWTEIRGAIGIGALLATVGIVVSIAVVAVITHFALGLDWWIAVLLGAVCSPTDSAAVFSVLRRLPLPQRLRSVLEAESGLNDAPTVLVVSMVSLIAAGSATLESSGGVLGTIALGVFELVVGVACGGLVGWLGIRLLRWVNLPSSGLQSIATLALPCLAFGVASVLHTSGFAAVYAAAVLIGNARLPFRTATRSFVEGVGWIAQIGLFVMLGLLASPARITPHVIMIALVAGAALTFLARPLSVLVCTIWFRLGWREGIFLSWAGLRGAVPIILATVPLVEGVPNALLLFDVVFVFVIIFTLLQAPTLPWLARRLGLADTEPDEVDLEVSSLDEISADLLQLRVAPDSRLAGVEVGELRLPRNVAISLVIRGDAMFAPGAAEVIRAGDTLLIVSPAALRGAVENRLRLVSRHGRLAGWRRAARRTLRGDGTP